MKTNTQILNLLGGPGLTKSTIAAGIFHKLKLKRINCEFITEYARDVVYEENYKLLNNQLYLLARQARRQLRLIDKVDFVITDSPLLLNSIYLKHHISRIPDGERQLSDSYIELCSDFYDRTFLEFNNINYLIKRSIAYEPRNRAHTEEEARMLDCEIKDKLDHLGIGYMLIEGDPQDIVDEIVRDILHL